MRVYLTETGVKAVEEMLTGSKAMWASSENAAAKSLPRPENLTIQYDPQSGEPFIIYDDHYQPLHKGWPFIKPEHIKRLTSSYTRSHDGIHEGVFTHGRTIMTVSGREARIITLTSRGMQVAKEDFCGGNYCSDKGWRKWCRRGIKRQN